MTNRILADIVHCSMSCALCHLTVSIRVAFFLAHKQARGPSCRSRPVACGYPDTSPTIACPGSRSSSSTARHQSNQTAPGCFMVFCSTCPLAILHQSCSSQAPRESQEGGRGHRCWDHLFQSWLQEPADESDPCLRSSMQTSVVMVFEFVTHLLQTSWRHCSDFVCHIYFIWTTPGCEISQIGFRKATSTCCGSTATADATGHRRWHPFYGQCRARSRTLKRILGWINSKISKFALLHIQKFFFATTCMQWQQSERQPSFECN